VLDPEIDREPRGPVRSVQLAVLAPLRLELETNFDRELNLPLRYGGSQQGTCGPVRWSERVAVWRKDVGIAVTGTRRRWDDS
jgi:hypothetical protein